MSLVGKRDRVSNYYSVKNGKVVLSLGKEEPQVMEGVQMRVNKNGETVYEIVNDYIAGHIVDLDLQQPPEDKPDYKELMLITMESDGTKAIVQIPFDSAYGRGFLNSASGIDFSDPVELEPYKYTDKKAGREKMGCGVIQYGKQLPWTMGTRDNPGGVPELEEVEFKGKKAWDNTKQLAFYHEFYEELKAKVAEAAGAEIAEEEEPEVGF